MTISLMLSAAEPFDFGVTNDQAAEEQQLSERKRVVTLVLTGRSHCVRTSCERMEKQALLGLAGRGSQGGFTLSQKGVPSQRDLVIKSQITLLAQE